MMDARWNQLRQVLIDSGWVCRDDALVAPHETMWFNTNVENPNFAQFRDSMTEAVHAASDDLKVDVDQLGLHQDLVSLVAALDAILDGN